MIAGQMNGRDDGVAIPILGIEQSDECVPFRRRIENCGRPLEQVR